MPSLQALARRGTTDALLAVTAVVLLCEEWFWDRSTAVLARCGRLPVVRAAESWARRRPPHQALALFGIPVIVIYPCKAVALFAVGTGHVTAGLAAFLLAKVVATALFARVYQLTEAAIVHIRWVRRCRDGFLRLRRFVHAWLNMRPVYRRVRNRLRCRAARMAGRYRAVYRLQQQRHAQRRIYASWERPPATTSSSAAP